MSQHTMGKQLAAGGAWGRADILAKPSQSLQGQVVQQQGGAGKVHSASGQPRKPCMSRELSGSGMRRYR